MTLQESQLLQDFLNQLSQVHANPRDPEAQVMIEKAMARQPDALYLLVQRSMLLDQALSQAKAQIVQLQQQRGNFPGGGSAWNQTPPEPLRSVPPPGNATTAPQPSSGFLSGGAGSFLGSAAATAAGVAGGAFLFQGLEGLFGHHGGGFPGQDAPGDVIENVTVNNYEGDDASRHSAGEDEKDPYLDADDDASSDDSSWA